MGERRFDIHEIRGAVARGWYHPKTKHLEMDVELAEAISYEVLQLLLHDTEQPKPKDEWEEWIGEGAVLVGMCIDQFNLSEQVIKDWLRRMPRGSNVSNRK